MKILQIKFFLLFSVITFSVFSQSKSDLFSLSNSKKYANHLFQKGEYDLAFEEYKRLTFLDSSNTFFKTRLLKSSYESGDFKKGIKVGRTFYESDSLFPKPVAREFTYLLLYSGYTWRTSSFLNSNSTFSLEDRLFFGMSNLLLDYQFQEARKKYDQEYLGFTSLKVQNLETIISQAESFKPKSPFLAGAMSAVIPGSGKVYAGQWKDGLFAFLYTGLSGYQAYRGFKKKGVKSVYGWVFAGISGGFYLGNVYGSFKAIRKRREIHREDIIQQTKNVLASSY